MRHSSFPAMLSALELNGFKSFAERTRFEFPAGITVVVGPNGSGKSNVVDAIKWVLGAQSVKALRGKEMTDVIFSGSRTRRPAGAAEASLIFDNSAGAFDHDAAEIQITRRVYRSGESEYLINRQPCRLRDVRDLLADVGMSSGAYSIIEQGKVDAVLQASPKERRLIFEEAAGVSRFRIKREEAARRLERVEQNLLRLADIVGELDARLQNVRSQAGKAQKYATAARRLEELRTRVALEDWRRFSTGIARLSTDASAAEGELANAQRQLAECEARVAEVDASIEELQRSFRDLAAAESTVRERAAQCQSTRSSHLARVDELKLEFQRLGEQLLLLATRAGDAQQLLAQTTADLDAAERQCRQGGETLAQRQQALANAERQFASDDQAAANSQTELDQAEAEAIQQLQQQQFLEAKRQAAEASLARLLEEAAPLKVACDRYAADRKQAEASLSQHAAALSHATEDLKAVQTRLAADRSQLAALHKRQAELEGRLTGARERQLMLEELERRLDGLTSGAKDVLHKAAQDPGGPFRTVRGVVADLLHVDADSASLIEIALGERANHLVVTETRSLAPVLAQEAGAWAGRTSFLRLDVPAPASAVDRVDLSAEPGVVGRADSFVEAGEELAPMVRRLLGRHWLVDTLATALRLANGPGRGLNFVTVAGEVVLADGTLTVGPRQNIAGLLSRRSELRALREQIAQMEQDASSTARECLGLEESVSRHEVATTELSARQAAAAATHGESRLRLASLTEKLEQAEGRMASVEAAAKAASAEAAELTATLEASRTRAAQLADEIAACRSAIAAAADKRAQGEARLAELRQALTEQRIEQARNEQRVEGLNRQFEQLQRDRAERHSLLEDTRTRAAECQAQKARLETSAAALAVEAAELTAMKDQYIARLAELEQDRAAHRTQRTAAASSAESARTQVIAGEQRRQATSLQLSQLQQQRTTVADRIREDYGFDLADRAEQAELQPASAENEADAATDREAMDDEIRKLRGQLQGAGPVNLESLSELESLESRYASLSEQYRDLETARQRLQQIVQQINGESRELFVAAVDAIRGHFQEIFRGLFAGGEADVVLEEDPSGDVLECGVNIIARPPGKQPRNISLLSGGERTLTCVALLLAVFRSRPSPFCVLDEVDAALDEANIDRFVEVLKEFMQTTQFVVITHSKRTMTCSDTLYGVTMQESGVSKRVSVRFEDVSEDGHIKPASLRAA